MTHTHQKSNESLFAQEEPRKPKRKLGSGKRANDLDGAKWLTNSISVWKDIRKTAEEASLGHPAMFPTMLVERLLESLTTKHDKVILDPFMGSGSTLVAARQMGKAGIGLDISDEYIQLAKRRLSQLTLDCARSKPEETVIHKSDARGLLNFVDQDSVDLTITSPPYWDILNQQRTADYKRIRNYGNLENDLGTIADYHTFLNSLKDVFEAVHIVTKSERYCVVVVMDIRKKDQFYPLHSDFACMMQSIGFIFDDIIIWNRQSEYNNLRPLGYPFVFRINKVHEYCLIFRTKSRKEKTTRDKELLANRELPRS